MPVKSSAFGRINLHKTSNLGMHMGNFPSRGNWGIVMIVAYIDIDIYTAKI